jgi:hypothetical protein
VIVYAVLIRRDESEDQIWVSAIRRKVCAFGAQSMNALLSNLDLASIRSPPANSIFSRCFWRAAAMMVLAEL